MKIIFDGMATPYGSAKDYATLLNVQWTRYVYSNAIFHRHSFQIALSCPMVVNTSDTLQWRHN